MFWLVFYWNQMWNLLMNVSPQFGIQNAKDDITLWAWKWLQAHFSEFWQTKVNVTYLFKLSSWNTNKQGEKREASMCSFISTYIQWYCYSGCNFAHSVCKFAHSVNFCTKSSLSSLWAMSHFGVKIVQASKPHCLFCCTSLIYTNWLGDALIWFCFTCLH